MIMGSAVPSSEHSHVIDQLKNMYQGVRRWKVDPHVNHDKLGALLNKREKECWQLYLMLPCQKHDYLTLIWERRQDD